ncbi:MAG: hypothetical protein KDA37_18960 [Planctomycetales bacterium]|nr:hypothetical protein [Planctomycetales bacterium]
MFWFYKGLFAIFLVTASLAIFLPPIAAIIGWNQDFLERKYSVESFGFCDPFAFKWPATFDEMTQLVDIVKAPAIGITQNFRLCPLVRNAPNALSVQLPPRLPAPPQYQGEQPLDPPHTCPPTDASPGSLPSKQAVSVCHSSKRIESCS